MYMESDYIMRMIHEMVRMIIRLLFGKDIDQEKDDSVAPELSELYRRLLLMIGDGKLNEAENSLIENLDADNREYFRMALLFYEKLNEKSDDFLEDHGFSRQEVIDGLKYVVRVYECGPMIDAFLEDYV